MSCEKILKALCCCSPCCGVNAQPEANLATYPVDVERAYRDYSEAFSYENLLASKQVDFRDYQALMDDQFFRINRISGNAGAPAVGWKIHISLDDSDFNNIAKGWDTVKEVLMENNIDYFKVVRPDATKDDVASKYETGRQITIYATGDLINYERMLQRITDELVRNQVRPGYSPKGDEIITGSKYFYYRNDDNGSGGYLPAGKDKSYNETATEDPFMNVRIANNSQPQTRVKVAGPLAIETMFIKHS